MTPPKKSYRPNVAAVILSPEYPSVCELFLGRRMDFKRVWQFPQGGIDSGETPKDALFRELREEIGTDEIEIIAECPRWISYDFPKGLARKMYPFDGQNQKYFLVRLKNREKINLQTPDPEFDAYKFVAVEEILRKIKHFKRPVYAEVLGYFKNQGFL